MCIAIYGGKFAASFVILKRGEPKKFNSENPKVGRSFEELTARLLSDHFQVNFDLNISMPIGDPPKGHRFDCVSVDHKIVAECKCFTWTTTGNVPSAKMGFANQAAFYLSFLPDSTTKIIVMKKFVHTKRTETLMEYYDRTYRHLIKEIWLFEIDEANERIRVVKEGKSVRKGEPE